MPRRDSDRNLLFGILALQMDFVTRDALLAGMNAWVLEKHRPIGEILVERRWLDAQARSLLEPMVDLHVARHGGDPVQSLAALSSLGGVASDLRREVADPEVRESLAFVPPSWANNDPPATRAPETIVCNPTGVRYRKVRDHASGGLGIVFVARDEELHREVALKEIKPKYADNPASQARFLLEAEITGGLEHPGIVPVYGLGHYEDGRPFYAMRFIRGDSLKEAIAAFHADGSFDSDSGARTLALQKLLRRFLDVCNAIDYAHSRGVLHRDLKPDNVMVGRFGETLVVDWGLAKSVGRSGTDVRGPLPESTGFYQSPSGSAETLPGSVVGTPGYMSPEQAAGRLDLLGPASDVYGLGATLYTLLTGRVAFVEKELRDVLHKVERGQFPRPRELSPWLDPSLEAICLKAMALLPIARYSSPKAMSEDVERWLADEPVAAHRESWARRASRWARKHRSAVTTVASTALVAALLIGVYESVRFDRTRRTDQAALATLAKAEQLEILARETADLNRWSDAVAAVGKAESQLETGGGSVSLKIRARAKLATLREAMLAEERDQKTVVELREARLKRANIKDERNDAEAEVGAYLSAFRSCGIDVLALPAEEAARRIRESRIARQLVAALDEWASGEATNVPRERLSAIAKVADPNPEMGPIRDAMARQDAAGLRRLVEDEAVRRRLDAYLHPIFFALVRLDLSASLPLLEVIRREHPDDYWFNVEIAQGFERSNPPDTEAALRYYTAADAIRPRTPALLNGLGNARRARGDLEGAICAYQEAIRIQPDLALPHCNLGLLLKSQGLYREALESLERGHALGSRQPGWRFPSEAWVREARRFVDLEAKLSAILKGEAAGGSVEERIALAGLCYKKGLQVAAVRFWGEAFAGRPALLDDLENHNRYNAACAAALASSGAGRDDPPPGEAARFGLRGKALGWLRADLATWTTILDGENEPARKQALAPTLAHWQVDPDLFGIRDKEALSRLPLVEQEALRSLWADVEALRKKAEGAGGR